MKLFLKLFTALVITITGLYLASPLWLPPILASQLPEDWHLENLNMSWPGWSGVTIQHLDIRGELPGLDLKIAADDSRLTYKGMATHIDTVSIGVFVSSKGADSSKPFTVDDLSLPVLRLRAGIPELTVDQMKLALHLPVESQSGSSSAAAPIELALQGFKLSPDELGGYQVKTAAQLIGQPQVNGYFAIEVAAGGLSADVRFPAETNRPAWLELSVSQRLNATDTGTQVHAVFDSDLAGQQWVDDLLNNSTAGRLTHLSGRLEAQAVFSGLDSHGIKNLSLSASQMQIDLDGNSLLINADMHADRQQDLITLTLPAAATIEFLDSSGKLDQALAQAVPELSRSGNTAGKLTLRFAEEGQLDIESPNGILSAPAFQYGGDVELNYGADSSSLKLAASGTRLAISDTSQLQNFELKSDIRLNWNEQKAFSYVSDSINFKSDSLALATSGRLKVSAGMLKFNTEEPIVARLPKLHFKLQTGTASTPSRVELQADDFNTDNGQLELNLTQADSALEYVFEGPLKTTKTKIIIVSSAKPDATIVDAAALEVNVTLDSRNDHLASSGSGHLSMAHVEPQAVSANRIDLKWDALDLSLLTGKVNARTQGLKVKLEEQSWSGFDFDLNLDLLANDAVKGVGDFTFTGGPKLPVNLEGNIGTGWWDVSINNTSVPSNQLRSIFNSAQIKLPAELKLTEGSIDVAGQIAIHEDMSATFDLAGSDIAAAIAKSSVRKTSFKISSGYQGDVFASGPLDIENMMLAGGIGVTDLHMDLDVKNSQSFHVSNLKAGLFEGELELKQLDFVDGSIEDTSILASRINLQRLLEYLDVNGLSGTGNIDFVLPAGSEHGAIHITDGTFTSTGPGKLSYSSGGAASTNIGLKALDNFHYKKLSGTIAYNSKGPYQIGIRLEGSNPDLYSGYPLIFNLNIGGSLPEVFEAMFMTGSFEEAILKQVKIKQ